MKKSVHFVDGRLGGPINQIAVWHGQDFVPRIGERVALPVGSGMVFHEVTMLVHYEFEVHVFCDNLVKRAEAQELERKQKQRP